MTIELEKLSIAEFDGLSQIDKNTYIIWLLSLKEEDKTGVDKHILKFNSVGTNHLQILEIQE